jgi:hypothetical protein
MSEDDFDWYETRTITRFSTRIKIYWVVILIVMLVSLMTGLLSEIVILLILAIGFIATAIGYYLGVGNIIKRHPLKVGLSSEVIRLQYRDGHHKDIPWDDIDAIVEEGWTNHPGIKRKDGSVTTLVLFPKYIITRMETEFQKMKNAVEKVN